MRTVTFKSVLYGISRLVGITDPAQELNAVRAEDITAYLNERFREAWEWEWWSEWTRTERRRFAPDYDTGVTYTAPTIRTADFVWFPAAKKYYQALRGGTLGAPATLSGSSYITNTGDWMIANSAAVSASDDWTASTVYALADLVRNPEDGEHYSCISAHTSSASFDATKFGLVVDFVKRIVWDQTDNVYEATTVAETQIGQIRQISRKDPRLKTNPVTLTWSPDDIGAWVPSGGDQVWLQFRIPAPEFTSTAYGSTTAYAVADTVYYDTTGESYKCIQAATGNLPTDTAYWTKIDFPRAISGFIKKSVASDLLAEQKQGATAAMFEAQAYDELANAADRDQAMQGQQDRAQVTGMRG